MKITTLAPAILGLTLCCSGLASAQPDGGNAGKAQNPPVWANQGMGNMRNMTPEQRAAAMQQMVKVTIRESLKNVGVTDAETVNTITLFAEAQEKSKNEVREKAKILIKGLIGPDKTDEDVTANLEELRKDIEEAKTQQKTDVEKLEEMTEFSKKPKLQAVLTLLGLIGDESMYLQGLMGTSMNIIGLYMEAMQPQPAAADPEAGQ